jgi:putative addiction module killer protein
MKRTNFVQEKPLIEIRVYQDKNKREPFVKWLKTIRDATVKARIQQRIRRIEVDRNFGDAKSLGDGVYELKLQFGPGYRVYFGKVNFQLVLLLVAGDKSSQEKDIKIAKVYWKDYKERENG